MPLGGPYGSFPLVAVAGDADTLMRIDVRCHHYHRDRLLGETRLPEALRITELTLNYRLSRNPDVSGRERAQEEVRK